MNRKSYLLIFIFLITASISCKKDIQTFTIIRTPLLTFQTDIGATISTSDTRFFGGATTIHTYPDGSQQDLSKFVLQSRGTDNQGRSFVLQIEVDITVNGNYVGIYRPVYDPAIGGLADFRYILRQGNQFIEYGLDPGNNLAFIQVEAQNNEERIIRGSFAATLRNLSDTSAALLPISSGTFTDIPF